MNKIYPSLRNGVLAAMCLLTTLCFGQESAKQLVDSYINANKASLGLLNEVNNTFEIERSTVDVKRGLKRHYVKQAINGLTLFNSSAVFVEKGERFILSGNSFITDNGSVVDVSAKKSPQAIFNLVWANLEQEFSTVEVEITQIDANKFVLHQDEYSRTDIPMELGYFFDGTTYRLVYDMSIEMKDSKNWWNISADASTGEILAQYNWVVSCSFENCSTEKHFNHTSLKKNDISHSWMMAPAPPPGDDAYRVVVLPNESPNHGVGNSQLVTGPFNPSASPFGWHDTDGAAGAEYTITRGNNVLASEDRDANNSPGYSPDGGASLNFDFPLIGDNDPTTYLDAAITNLFYMNNMMHDIYYAYGFDEPNGNFQANNYGNGGNANDYVLADAQDGSGTNNANFGTPPDGGRPRMQMFVWTGSGSSRMINITNPSDISGNYDTGRGNFGPPIPNDTVLSGEVVYAIDSVGNDPIDGCDSIINPTEVNGKIAFIRNSNTCSFSDKVEQCQKAGAIAVIIMNNALGDPNDYSSNPTNPITIPSLMVSRSLGIEIINKLNANVLVTADLFDRGWDGNTDSDLDNGIIGHEYGHGISNRLTGGPAAASCLQNAEQMGEGWGDFVGLVVAIKEGDTGEDKRGVGTFVSNQSTAGNGIRPTPYSTNFGINSSTYATSNNPNISQPHGIGYVWATMLWDLTWKLIDTYGFDADLFAGTGGNNMSIELVTQGMALQRCSPGFVDGRDAIILADELINNGANECLIWEVFARRGLGFEARQGSTNNRSDQVEDFGVPQKCWTGLNQNMKEENQLMVFPNPAFDQLSVATSSDNMILNVRVLDLNGRLVGYFNDVNKTDFNFDVSSFDSGVYLVEVQTEKATLTKRVVKN
jgi:extracellular elastinolytic metalloproteinase